MAKKKDIKKIDLEVRFDKDYLYIKPEKNVIKLPSEIKLAGKKFKVRWD